MVRAFPPALLLLVAGCGTVESPDLVPCDDQYGAVVGYEPCDETASSCTFAMFEPDQPSCAALCGAQGGECIRAEDSDDGTCATSGPAGCESGGHESLRCECSRGCGGGPPCAEAETCVEGVCR